MSWSSDSVSTDGDFDMDSHPCRNVDNSNVRNKMDSSSSSEDDITIPSAVDQPHFSGNDSHILDNPVRRSSRIRKQPERFNAVEYDCDTPFNGEGDTVQNWWPNYPRGSWSPNRGSM